MRLFLFAIGGTGSRVLKSLAMLLAAGVRPLDADGHPVKDLEVVPLIIDPHKGNEDLKRTDLLLNDYRMLRERLHGTARDADGFFATRIVTLREIMSDLSVTLNDTFVFNMNAVEQNRFADFIGYDTMNEPNQALTSLLFAPYQLDNKMNIGFVGSPNIGSVALNEVKDSDEFKAFAAVFRPGDRVFFISSIFGGTGAAGFPILVKNIRQAYRLEGIDNRDALSRAPIGGLTVLPYFNIEADRNDSRISANDFLVKTQSALYYYRGTLTGDNDSQVNAIYYVGDQVRSLPYRYDPGEHGQRNNAHLVELVGALAPLQFVGMPDSRLSDRDGRPLPTAAFEYALEHDVHDVDFKALGAATRALIYKPMVKLHLLRHYLKHGFESTIGQGYTEDKPRITRDLLATQFYRSLTGDFMDAYNDWLDEMRHNSRSVKLFDLTQRDMAHLVTGVDTRKGLLGHKSIDANTFKAQMNRLSRQLARQYDAATPEAKLLDLFNRAADQIIDQRLQPIN